MHPKTKLLIAHGGYNSFLEASQAGLPVVLMPLFADQFINAKRAQRFGIATVLDKLNLNPDKVEEAIATVLNDYKCTVKAKRLAAMLKEKPSSDPGFTIKSSLRTATKQKDDFALKAAQRLSFIEFYLIDVVSVVIFIVILPMFWLAKKV